MVGTLDITCIPVLRDNYMWVAQCQATGVVAVVDPALSGPVLDVCAQKGVALSCVLVTHHHADHVGGVLELKQRTGCRVIGYGDDAARLPGLDELVDDQEEIRVGQARATVMAVPGHTSGHIAFYFADDHALFCGDALFLLGCGRMFEGTPEQFWRSLCTLRALPDVTRVFCAHEYTESNCRFVRSLEPDNVELLVRERTILETRAQGLPTVPGSLGEEKRLNPFLRADTAHMAQLLGCQDGIDPVHVFAELRQRKDVF